MDQLHATSLDAGRRPIKSRVFNSIQFILLGSINPRVITSILQYDAELIILLLGPFHGAIAVPSVTRCRCRRWRRGHRCAGGTRQYRWRHLVNGREAARSNLVNGPNIFQMLLVILCHLIYSPSQIKCYGLLLSNAAKTTNESQLERHWYIF